MGFAVMRSAARPLLWLALAAPAAMMVVGFAQGAILPMDLLHPSGEMSVRLMIAAMLAGPLAGVFGPNRFFRGWLSIRRNLGVAAFGYALLHLVFYVIDMAAPAAILDELGLPPIWTGWLALVLMIPPAAISFDAALRALGWRRWKGVQRLVYAALLIALVHWLLLDWNWRPAALHLAPLAIAWLALAATRLKNREPARSPSP